MQWRDFNLLEIDLIQPLVFRSPIDSLIFFGLVIKITSLKSECLQIEVSMVTQPRVSIISQGSSSESISFLDFGDK